MQNATRIIEISDGEIISDRPNVPDQAAEPIKSDPDAAPALQGKQKKGKSISAWRSTLDRLSEAFQMALLSMNAHRMRTF